MNNYFIQSGIIAAIYAIFKFFEARITNKQTTPKEIIRDTVLVFVSAVVGAYIVLQTSSTLTQKMTNAYLGEPEF